MLNRVIIRMGGLLVLAVMLTVSCHKKEEPMFNEERIEEICQKVEAVTSMMGNCFLESATIEDMMEHREDFLAMDGVEEVYADGLTVNVKIKGWRTISYLFTSDSEEPGYDEIQLESVEKELETRVDIDNSGLKDYSPCIINQQFKDESRGWVRSIVNHTEQMFRDCQMKPQIENYPSVSFFRDEIFQYDLIFLITHGYYSPETGLHWIVTGEEYDSYNNAIIASALTDNPLIRYPDTQVRSLGVEEKRNGEKTVVYYASVSEEFISSSTKQFKEKGKPVFFNVACQSLMGNHSRHNDRDIDMALADAFFAKGAGLYIGYDESSCWNAQRGGMIFYGKLLSGESFKASLNQFPDKEYTLHSHRRDDRSKYTVAMHYLTANGFSVNSFIVEPTVIGINDESDGLSIKITLTGDTPYSHPIGDYTFLDTDIVEYGFFIGKSDSLKSAKKYISTKKVFSFINHSVSFDVLLSTNDLEFDTDYYCWPYMFDGTYYNYGRMEIFSTNRINQVVPERLLDEIEEYIPVFHGVNPPNVEGQYVMSPEELIYDSTYGYDPGYVFSDLYFQFLNQDMVNNSLDYKEKQGESSGLGTGAFISGEGDHFSVFFNTDKTAVFSDYTVYYKTALVLSGTKTKDGIKDMYRAFVVVEKSDDPNNHIIPVDAIRILKDGDGLCSTTNYFKSPSSAVMKQLPYNPSLLPDRIEAER